MAIGYWGAVAIFVIVTALITFSPEILKFLSYRRELTPERKMLLRMLGDLADEEFCWEFHDDDECADGRAVHKDSGISIERLKCWDGIRGNTKFFVNIPDCFRPIEFMYHTKGGRICRRIFRIRDRAVDNELEQRRKAEDAKQLEATVKAFTRMSKIDRTGAP
jgi:hypothetical protein